MRAWSFTPQNLRILRHDEAAPEAVSERASWRRRGGAKPRAARSGDVRELTSSSRIAASGPRECGSGACSWAGVGVAALAAVCGFPESAFLARTMATDSWALAVDEQEAAVKSVSGFSSRRGERSRRAQADTACGPRSCLGWADPGPAHPEGLLRGVS